MVEDVGSNRLQPLFDAKRIIQSCQLLKPSNHKIGLPMNKREDKFSMAEFYDIMDSIREGIEQGAYSGAFDPRVDEEVDPELFKLFQEYSLDRNNVVHWQLLARALSNFIRVGTGGRSLEWTPKRKGLLIEKGYKIKKSDPHAIS